MQFENYLCNVIKGNVCTHQRNEIGAILMGGLDVIDPILGTIDGNVVRLDEPTSLPAGCRVEVQIQPLKPSTRRRAKVGETTGPGFQVSDEALAPLTSDELREWGL